VLGFTITLNFFLSTVNGIMSPDKFRMMESPEAVGASTSASKPVDHRTSQISIADTSRAKQRRRSLSYRNLICTYFLRAEGKSLLAITIINHSHAGYNSKGERLVSGVVPLSSDKKSVLLVQSSSRPAWIIPKGGWEVDKECDEAARREAMEEAGIEIRIDDYLGEFEQAPRPPQQFVEQGCLFHFYEATVLEEKEEWPEKHIRERRWMGYAEAFDALSGRLEQQEALQKSTIKK
jgi:diphosphoinositol-polyphosphate diphosphatase